MNTTLKDLLFFIPWLIGLLLAVGLSQETRAYTVEPPEEVALPSSTELSHQVLELINRSFQYMAQGDVTGLLSTYADRVDYFTNGVVDKSFIRQDKEYYFKNGPRLNLPLMVN